MIERIDLPGHIVGLTARGRVSKADYKRVVIPIVEEAGREGRRMRLLYDLGREFKGFTPAALLQDARLGLRGADVMDRVALVTDTKWLGAASTLFDRLVPCLVRSFPTGERDAAIEWLNRPAQHKGLTHRVASNGRVVVVVVVGQITSEDFEALGLAVDELLDKGRLEGLVVHAKNAPSWEDLGSLLRHLNFVRTHHKRIRRVALVTQSALAPFVPALARRLLAAEVHCFAEDDLEVAVYWASGRDARNGDERDRPRGLDPVEQAGLESFPASDPPSFTPGV